MVASGSRSCAIVDACNDLPISDLLAHLLLFRTPIVVVETRDDGECWHVSTARRSKSRYSWAMAAAGGTDDTDSTRRHNLLSTTNILPVGLTGICSGVDQQSYVVHLRACTTCSFCHTVEPWKFSEYRQLGHCHYLQRAMRPSSITCLDCERSQVSIRRLLPSTLIPRHFPLSKRLCLTTRTLVLPIHHFLRQERPHCLELPWQ